MFCYGYFPVLVYREYLSESPDITDQVSLAGILVLKENVYFLIQWWKGFYRTVTNIYT